MQRPLILMTALLACLTAVPRVSRGQATPSNLQTQVDRLAAALRKADSTIVRLEARVARLERKDESDDKDTRDEVEKAEEAREKANIERRLSTLERASAAKGDPNTTSRTVRAPFVVEDTDGSVILRVTGGKSPRLLVGVDKGGGVELGTGSAGGGLLRVRDATSADRVILIGSDGFGQLRAISQTHSAVLSSTDNENGATLGLFIGDVPSARIRSGLSGYGTIVLTTPNGTESVFVGSRKGGT